MSGAGGRQLHTGASYQRAALRHTHHMQSCSTDPIPHAPHTPHAPHPRHPPAQVSSSICSASSRGKWSVTAAASSDERSAGVAPDCVSTRSVAAAYIPRGGCQRMWWGVGGGGGGKQGEARCERLVVILVILGKRSSPSPPSSTAPRLHASTPPPPAPPPTCVVDLQAPHHLLKLLLGQALGLNSTHTGGRWGHSRCEAGWKGSDGAARALGKPNPHLATPQGAAAPGHPPPCPCPLPPELYRTSSPLYCASQASSSASKSYSTRMGSSYPTPPAAAGAGGLSSSKQQS